MFVRVQVCVQGCMQKYTSMCTWAGGEALVLLLRHCPLSFPETGSLTDLELIKTDQAGQRCPGNRFHLPPQCWDWKCELPHLACKIRVLRLKFIFLCL